MNQKSEQEQKIEQLAKQILNLARDAIVVNMRFMDVSLSKLSLESKPSLRGVACDGRKIYYDGSVILKKYQSEPQSIVRMVLHILLHCIFHHNYNYGKIEPESWDLATDIAVENIMIELNIGAATLQADVERKEKLKIIRKNAGALTAEKIYKSFLVNPLSEDGKKELIALFKQDEHFYWGEKEEISITMEQWKKISERVKADLRTFSKDKSHSESLSENLAEATKERYNYSDILKRFTVMGEDMTINDDEFDYVYYTYGLSTYGNMPLIEPLEYKEVKKVKEFAIVIDTSASCKGPVVKAFLKKTYSILKGTENFFHQINVHIIQNDNEVHSDTKVTCDEDFENFFKNGKLVGFGGTDFRPAFSYVEQLILNGEFENFKGLIYFTDGYGIYPERMPEFDSLFVFLNEDVNQPQVPAWAIKVVLEETEISNEY